MRRARSVESAQRGRACWLQSGRVDGGIPATLSLTDAPSSRFRCAASCSDSSQARITHSPQPRWSHCRSAWGPRAHPTCCRGPCAIPSKPPQTGVGEMHRFPVIGLDWPLEGPLWQWEQQLSQPGERTHADHTNGVIADARRSPPTWYQEGGAGPPQFGGWEKAATTPRSATKRRLVGEVVIGPG